MSNLKKYIPISLAIMAAVVAAQPSASAANLTVKAKADSTTLTMGDQVGINVEVVKTSHQGAFVDMPKPEQDYNGMEMISYTADSTNIGNGRIKLTYNFLFQAFEPATLVSLPGFRYAVDGDTAVSDIISFKVLPVELSPELGDVNNVDSLTIHPDEPVIAVKAKWYDYIPDWTPWAILGLMAIALGVVLFMLYKKNGPAIFVPRKPIPPYDLAMQRLNALKQKHLIEQGHIKQYYTEVTDILRSYLEGRFGIYAMEMTSKQILKHLRENQETNLSADQIEQTLELADFVKFAGVRPLPQDDAKTYSTIYNFVESTRPAPETEEPQQKAPVKRRKLRPKRK